MQALRALSRGCTASWCGALGELPAQRAQLERHQPAELLAALLELIGDPIDVRTGAVVALEQAPSGRMELWSCCSVPTSSSDSIPKLERSAAE